MKKRLFTLLACAATMLAAYAQQVGDYAYTKEARYKITGENMIPNGDFSEMDAGWTTDSGEALDATVFDTANGYL